MKSAITLVALICSIPAAAAAQQPVSVRIETSGLDLSTAEGQQRLETRVRTHIRRACDAGLRGVTAARREATCRNAMHEMADRKVAFAITQAQGEQLVQIATEAAEPGA